MVSLDVGARCPFDALILASGAVSHRVQFVVLGSDSGAVIMERKPAGIAVVTEEAMAGEQGRIGVRPLSVTHALLGLIPTVKHTSHPR